MKLLRAILFFFACLFSVQFSSVAQLCLTLQPHGLRPGLLFNNSSRSLPKLMSIESVMPSTISSSVVPFSSCLQSFLASESFRVSQFFASGDQSVRASASTSVLPMNIQDWFPLGLTDWIYLHSKGRSRVFSNTTVQKHLFFSAQLSL